MTAHSLDFDTPPSPARPTGRPLAGSPFVLPPPPASHPMRWRRVGKLLRDIRSADDQVEAGLLLFDAVGGVGGEKTFQRFAQSAEGERLLRTQPDLVALLSDRDALETMPEGSLGRAYLDFAQTNGFTADGFVEKNRAVERERDETDSYRGWFWDRFTLSHDLWHVVAGCDTSPQGESTLLFFSFAQTPQRGYFALLGLITLTNLFKLANHRRHWRAWRAGRRARDLVKAPWEEILAWPLDDVRSCFRVTPIGV